MSGETFLLHLLNGLSFGSLLFFVASGLTLNFSLMRVVNVAHGSLYLVGGLCGVTAILATDNFWIGLLVGALSAALLGVVMETVLLRRVRGSFLREMLLTLGLSFIAADLALAWWGGEPRRVSVPSYLGGSVDLGVLTYPRLRLVVIGAALALAVAMFLVITRTRIGAIVRAGVDDREMVSALGVNVDRVFTGVFTVGTLLAGIAGVVGAAILSLGPGADGEILLLSFAIVIIGGLGSLPGAALGSMVVGLLDAFGRALFPEVASFTLFAPMLLILVVRPNGLLGRAAP